MNKDAIVQGLRAVAASDQRSLAACLRDIFDRPRGRRQELARHGLDMSLRTFDCTRARIRQAHGIRRGKRAAQPVPTESSPQTSAATHATRTRSASVNSAPNAHDAIPQPSSSSIAMLPDDWLSAKLTPAQFRLLTPAQRRHRRGHDVEQFSRTLMTSRHLNHECTIGRTQSR